MPIKIPNELPATNVLTAENIFVMTETRAITQDIRPLQILLLNLMPTKVDTETQLARVLGNTPLQIELELIAPSGHVSKNTSQAHMLAFYKTFDEVCERTFDGLVITGAPVELMEFEAGAVPDHGVVQDPRPLHPSYLLGGPGGALLPLWHPQAGAGEKALRRL